jgi:hypothetical protein
LLVESVGCRRPGWEGSPRRLDFVFAPPSDIARFSRRASGSWDDMGRHSMATLGGDARWRQRWPQGELEGGTGATQRDLRGGRGPRTGSFAGEGGEGQGGLGGRGPHGVSFGGKSTQYQPKAAQMTRHRIRRKVLCRKHQFPPQTAPSLLKSAQMTPQSGSHQDSVQNALVFAQIGTVSAEIATSVDSGTDDPPSNFQPKRHFRCRKRPG